ncbi:MAG: GTP-binding protein, partial [Promethearchaeota archaeon]
DPDSDGIINIYEYENGTSPQSSDTDMDGMPDKWEIDNNLKPNSPDDRLLDTDNDGLLNIDEYGNNTDPHDNDTDDDGMFDGWEVKYILNPLNAGDRNEDPDGDLLTNIEEYNLGTEPRNPDTDGDGFIDGRDPAPLNFINPTGYIIIIFILGVIALLSIYNFVRRKIERRKRAKREWLRSLEERARKEEEERIKYISSIKEHYPDKLEGTIEAIKKVKEIAEYYMKNDIKGKVVECLEMELTLYKNALEQADEMGARTVIPTLREDLINVRGVLMDYRRGFFAEEHNRLKAELSGAREKEEFKEERDLLKAIEKNTDTYMDFLNRYGVSEGLEELNDIKSEVERALEELDVRDAIKELNEGYNEIVKSIKNKDLTGASSSREKLLKKVREILNSLGNYNLSGEVLGQYEGALSGLERKLEGLGIKIEEAVKSMIGGRSWSLSLDDYKVYKIEVGFSEIRGVSGSEFKRPLYAKVVLLGESSVGKTHLILSMTGREYKAKQGSTVGVDKYYKPVRTVFKEYDTELCFWDLGGQWNFRSVNSLFLNEASVVVLVFDVTRRETFEALAYWYKQVEYSRGIGDAPIILVGNKIDVGGAAVLRDEVRSFCASAGLKFKYYETSAETGEGLDKLLEAIAGGVDWSVLIKSFDSNLAYRVGRELQELSKQFKILHKAKLLGELKSRMTGATDLELGTVLNYFASQDRLQFGRFSEYVILNPEYIDKRIGRLLTKAARNGGLISRSDLDTIFNLKNREQSDMISDYLEQENICYDTGGGSYLFPNVIHKKEVELDEHLLEVLNSSPLEGSIEFDGPGDLIFHQSSIALSRELGVPEFISNTAGAWKFGSGHKLSVLLIYYLKRKGGGLVQLKAGGGDPESLINTAQRVVNNIINMHTRKNLMF